MKNIISFFIKFPIYANAIIIITAIAGLMSLNSFEDVRDTLIDLRKSARDLGVKIEEPFLQLAFLALPVIPSLKITDYGLVDVEKFKIIT